MLTDSANLLLERDVQDIARVCDTAAVGRLLEMRALRTGDVQTQYAAVGHPFPGRRVEHEPGAFHLIRHTIQCRRQPRAKGP